jgi:hypothetical protein
VLKLADTVRSHLRSFGGAPGTRSPVALDLAPRSPVEPMPRAPAPEWPTIATQPVREPEVEAARDAAGELLTQQMLTLVEIAATQDRQIQSLKACCERLERREQAAMVAFTAFFHILDANKISDLAAMAGVFGSLIGEAEQLDLPDDSILYLRQIETMLRDQHSDERDIG